MRWSLLSCLFIVACRPPAPSPDALFASIERRPFWGGGWYGVRISNGGALRWRGEGGVELFPPAMSLSAGEVEQVREAFAEAGYFKLTGDFACRGLSDLEIVTTVFFDGVDERTIRHDRGCRRPPGTAVLTAMEERIEAILGVPDSLGGY